MAQREAEVHARRVFRSIGCHVDSIAFIQRHGDEFARVTPEGETAMEKFLEFMTSPKMDQLVVVEEVPARASTIGDTTYIVAWAK